MEFSDFLKLIKRKRETIFTLVFIIVIFTLGISLLCPLKYQAKSRLLVIQETIGSDPYTVSKSNEYLGNLFAQIVYSGSFYDSVINSQYDIDKNYFSDDYNQEIKIWNQTVKTKTLADTGIIKINVYHPNPYQAKEIALAINNILINKNSNYQGNGSRIKIRVIDQPLISTYPVQPNILQNTILALAGGLLFALFYIYLLPEEKYNIKLWTKHDKLKKRRKNRRKNNKHSIKIDYYPDTSYKNLEYTPDNLPLADNNFQKNRNNDFSNFKKKESDEALDEKEAYKNKDFHPQGKITNVFK